MQTVLSLSGFDAAAIADHGSRFLLGNGYLGVRGTLAEYKKEQLVAINLAGIYHQAGDGWREPLNAPNPFFAVLTADGQPVALPDTACLSHEQRLDIVQGLQQRRTVFEGVTITEERFCHMEDVHLLSMRWCAQWTDEKAYDVIACTDTAVWDIHGPHYNAIQTGEGWVLAATDQGQQVAVARQQSIQRSGSSICLTVLAAVYTSNDGENPLAMAQAALQGVDYDALKETHINTWAALWAKAQVTIEGDEAAEFALNYSLYHLLCIAPRHASSLSIAARGLSGQTYKGAVFWDTEMFMLDFYLAVLPDVAKTLLRYRIDTLDGARKKAAHYGHRGAFYAWESQEGGYDACSDYNVTDVFTGRPMRTFFKDKQVHITAAVVYGLCKYQDWTGDHSLMQGGGAEVLIEAARFYYSLLWQHPGSDVYEIRDVIGPDEYHERVDNNAYTNEMARFCFEAAASRADDACPAEELKLYAEAAKRLKRQQPRADGVMAQFDGYFDLEDTSVDEVRARLLHEKEYWGGAYGVASHTQVIKQADVITLLYMLRGQYSKDILAANYAYYEPRTEHGSSLSACMYAGVACLLGQSDVAYPLFMKSASADLKGGGKQWAGLVYIGGTHPAAAGGAYMNFLHGFLGAAVENGVLVARPHLPSGWTGASCRVIWQGQNISLEA